MTINELIDTLKIKRELFPGNCEVFVWGEEDYENGLKLMEVCGHATEKELENDDAAFSKWTKLRKQFNADCCVHRNGEVIFLREIRDEAARIKL